MVMEKGFVCVCDSFSFKGSVQCGGGIVVHDCKVMATRRCHNHYVHKLRTAVQSGWSITARLSPRHHMYIVGTSARRSNPVTRSMLSIE